MDFIAAQCLSDKNYSRNSARIFQYGTAGFRDKSVDLPHVVFRMGLLAVLRSKYLHGRTVGLMITASHNPEEDNGVKLCDPDSKMLNREWEVIATQLINSNNPLQEDLSCIVKSNGIHYVLPGCVYLARDTRSSSPALAKAALEGIACLNGNVTDFGLLTTPQLHYVVFCKNYSSYGKPSVEGYYEKLSSSFEALRSNDVKKMKYLPKLYLDGANGIGALKFKEIKNYLKSLEVTIFNDGSSGKLNHNCGADFVKVGQKPSEGYEVEFGQRFASFDGDADRLVYYYVDKEKKFHLVDGDKIASLIAKYLKDLIDAAALNFDMKVVQTAYANGRSTRYIEDVLKVPVICVPTGVKHLHHEALKYDVGVYFEANGHGTVVFSEKVKKSLKELALDENAKESQKNAAKQFLTVIDLINETVGDAISDLLLVEVILHDLDWDIENWDKQYTDFPNRQLKVKVPDRSAITTTDAERKCVKPEGLQAAIDTIVSNFKFGRSFVRPSGTEDVVRVYAEAETQEQADLLAKEVESLIVKFT